MKNKSLHQRIFDISYKYKLSHIGSCITAVDIIDEIYQSKKENEPFILSSGHAGLALYVVIEKYGGRNAEEIWRHHGTHPDRCANCGLYYASGSLGHGLGGAVGMALADRTRNVYCLMSDGECAEGSIWESLRIASENRVANLRLYINSNDWGAYKKINTLALVNRLGRFVAEGDKKFTLDYSVVNTTWAIRQYPFLKGQDGHYHVLTEEEYKNV